jgi:hypothetical protein
LCAWCGVVVRRAAKIRAHSLFTQLLPFPPHTLQLHPQVILYPQSGGFAERGEAAPSPQLGAGCFDGYGQTREDYAYSSGPQLKALRNMIEALTL